MSTRAMAACWPLQMPPTVKAVLISLADQANDDGVCWPSVGTVTERTCLSERAVQNAIGWLEQNGYVSREMKAGRATRYTLTPAPNAPPHDVHPRTTCTTTPAPRAPAPAPRAPRTVKNRQLNRQEKKEGGFTLPDWLPADWWERWERHRAGMRKPLTDFARSLQVERLAELHRDGHEPTDCIKAAIEAHWQSFYPPRAATSPPAGRPASKGAAFLAALDRTVNDSGVVDVQAAAGPARLGR
jgi:hypothetical protein